MFLDQSCVYHARLTPDSTTLLTYNTPYSRTGKGPGMASMLYLGSEYVGSDPDSAIYKLRNAEEVTLPLCTSIFLFVKSGL